MRSICLGLCLAVGLAGAAVAETKDFALTYVGNEALFVDMAGLKQTGDIVDFRFFRVVKNGQTIMAKPYAAAWQEASINCKAHEYRALSQNIVFENADIAAKEYLRGEVYPITGGSSQAGLEAAVCRAAPEFNDRVATMPEAIKLGREKMGESQSASR